MNRLINYLGFLTDPDFVPPQHQWPRYKTILAIIITVLLIAGGIDHHA